MPTKSVISYKGEEISLPLYLDYQASTPLDYRVRDAMKPFMSALGNPHSKTHGLGHELAQAIEVARAQVAALISARPHEIIFTSGATEANNLALLGYAKTQKSQCHIISAATEHEAVLQPLKALADEGADVTLLAVNEHGQIDHGELDAAIRAETVLVTLMAANNETGVRHDLEAIGDICKRRNVAFHCDAVQALATEAINVTKCNLTFLSLSGHKLYGPAGIGALFIREGTEITPLVFGGNQERGLRAGTLPTMLCVGLGAAAKVATERREKDKANFADLRAKFKAVLIEELGNLIQFNGDIAPHTPGCLSVTIPGIDAEDLLFALPELALSTGSACTSRVGAPSHVLTAMGRSAIDAGATLRIGLGRERSALELDFAARQIASAVHKLIGSTGSIVRSM